MGKRVIGTLPSGLLGTGIAYTSSVVLTNASSWRGKAISLILTMLFDVSWPGGNLATQTWPPQGIGSLQGHVTLQGRPAPPNNQWLTPLTVVFLSPGTSVVLHTKDVITDSSGYFTIANIPAGTYDIGVKSPRALSLLVEDVIIFGDSTTSIEFGTLLEGDCNNDDVINGADYSILQDYFGKVTPEALAACDFNRDGAVTSLDYALLYANYDQVGALYDKWLPGTQGIGFPPIGTMFVDGGGSATHDFTFTLPSSANNQTITLTATAITSSGVVVATTQKQVTCGQPVTIYPGLINWRSSGQYLGFGAYDGIVVPYHDYVTVSPIWVNIGGVAVLGSVEMYVTSPNGIQTKLYPNGNSPYTLAPGAAVYVSFAPFMNTQIGTYRILFKLLVGGVVVSEASYSFISSY